MQQIEITYKTNIFSTPINEGSKRKFLMMSDDYITLKFSLATPIFFGLGAKVDNELGWFEVIDEQNPTYNDSTGGWDYELKLEAYYRKWKNKIFKFAPEYSSAETSWNLTATLAVHMDVFLRNLKQLGYNYRGKDFTYVIDSTVTTEAKLISYDGMNLIDALSEMCSEDNFDCEWWVEDNVIHLGRCEYGTAVDFKLGDNVLTMTSSESKNTYATRIYAFGSTRNLPDDYREDDTDTTTYGVYEKRLRLPKGTPYLDAEDDLTEEEAVEATVVFEEVYPRTNGKIDTIETYDSTVENDDGTTTTETFYRFTDSSIVFSKDYILDGEELEMKFTSGSLDGMTFGVNFNPKGLSESNPDAQLFEIVASEDYGRKLPDSILCPKVGDTYVFIGWDSTKIADLGLVDEAEQELLEKAQEYLKKAKIDPNTYDCTLMCTYAMEHTFSLGDKVNLVNDAFFKSGSRQSRIIGFEYSLDYPYDNPVYTVGETASYSRLGEIEDNVEELTKKGQTSTGSGGSSIYVVGQNDTTNPSDRNVFSSLRSRKEFLRKDTADTSNGKITFNKGFQTKDNATFGDFVSSLYAGKGGQIDASGNAEFESVAIRSALEVYELIVNRWTALEGDFPLTETDTIETVDDLGDGTYGLHLRSKWDGYFTAQKENNVIKGIINTLAGGSGDYYTSFMRVNSVNSAANYIEVTLYPDDEVPAGKNYAPSELMRIARWGNQTDESLQSLLYLSSTEGRIVHLTGVTKPILETYNYGSTMGTLPEFVQSVAGVLKGRDYFYAQGIVVQDRIKIDYNGKPVSEYVDRGTWEEGVKYYSNEYNEDYAGYETSDVWLYGCKWRCQKTGTTAKPAWNSTDWAMVEGNPDFTVDFAEQQQLYDLDNFALTLTLVATLYNQDVTDDITAENIEWTRYSLDASGNERTAADNAWALAHAGIGKQLKATIEDLGIDSTGFPSKVVFTCTATLKDGLTNSVNLEMI